MAEPITCPGCGEGLDLAAEYAGRRVRCPVCGHEFTAPVPDAGVPVARPVRRRRRRDPDEVDDDVVRDARRRVSGPASWLRVVGGLYFLTGLAGLAGTVVLGVQAADNPAAVVQNLNLKNEEELYFNLAALGVCSVMGVLLGGLMVYGAGKFQRLESHGWATAAAGVAIASVMFCTCNIMITLPLGVWALVVANNPDVREAFQIVAERRDRDGGE